MAEQLNTGTPDSNAVEIPVVAETQLKTQLAQTMKQHESSTNIKQASPPAAVDVGAAAAEFVAMLLFVYVGCGAAAHQASAPGSQPGGITDPAWTLCVAMAFGMAIMVLVYATAHTSGGQINCAVTLALVLTGELSVKQGVANFGAQMLGSVCGAALLLAGSSGSSGADFVPRDFTGGLGSNAINPRYSVGAAFVNEMMMTFLLVFVVFEVAVSKRSSAANCAPIAIGFAVLLAHLVCIPVTGCSINPTRSFGPAVVASWNGNKSVWDDHWLFWIAPLTGAVIAALGRGHFVVASNKQDEAKSQ